VYGPEYGQQWKLLIWLTASAAMAFATSCFTFAITAASCFREQVPLFAIVVSVSCITAFAAVPRIGLYGAALATLMAMTVQFIGTLLILRRALRHRVLDHPNQPAAVSSTALASNP